MDRRLEAEATKFASKRNKVGILGRTTVYEQMKKIKVNKQKMLKKIRNFF